MPESHESARPGSMAGKNVILFVTDQDRAIQHFPPGWAKENLPGLTRLQQNGLTFENAFTNSCMCSPARATLMTGYFPAQHGVKYTLEEDMDGPRYPQVEMPLDYRNLASVMQAAGYTVVYKGKWHLSKMTGDVWVPNDVGQYGFTRWNPADAGANQDIPEAGGGYPDNDARFMNDDGDWEAGHEGVLAYLRSVAAQQQPFFMVVSLVNPHDVLFYPKTYKQAAYTDNWLKGDIELPATVHEDLSTKPGCQKQFRDLFALTGLLDSDEKKRNYLNFYGNLMRASDDRLLQVLDLLDQVGLTDDTVVIRTADHGEMGMAHGGMRQKNFNFYEEAIRVPLVFSNPRLFPREQTSRALVSHVDFLPTLATLFGAPPGARTGWQGVDYAGVVLDPDAAAAPQGYVVFTWDDWQAGQASPPYVDPPNHIVSIREERWKLAMYYDTARLNPVPPQWEMYDLLTDPDECVNLCWEGHQRTEEQEREYLRLRRKLEEVQNTRLQPLGAVA
ncbi:sulfatase-like hydrolase/transferase [Longimicrobium sp.]|uniref:sulfatase-like hydrolase/transferase n=1 Tax=Longimicrobium sp. TaxID=2029185 RepID=UPI002B9C93DB|nr:sulfatase-like hydrolase/transferase [Longimicrobium sp.]HSU18006.1 sulfatase-like hydrolase/transferase [Longimicrobium sp.]